MTVTGLALKMRCELAELARKHNVVQRPPAPLPMMAPSSYAQVLSGFASTGDVDQERMKFRGHAFRLVSARHVRLLHRHDENQVAGEVQELSYDEFGRLKIRCRVDHEQARRCAAFSVSGRINEYRLCDVDSPNFYALITDATLDEISLTEIPSNRHALVTSRYPADARSKHLGNLLEWAGALQKLAAALPQLMVPSAAAQTAGAFMHKDTPRRVPRKGEYMHGANFAAQPARSAPSQPRLKTSFSELAEHLRSLEA